MQDIADAVGILKGSLYYYISSKEELLFEVTRDVARKAAATLPRTPGESRALTRLEAFIGAYAAFVAGNIEAVTVAVRDGRSLAEHRREAIAEIRADHLRSLGELVDEAQRDGDWRDDLDPRLVAEWLLGMGDWVAHRHAPGGRPRRPSRAYSSSSSSAARRAGDPLSCRQH